MEDGQRSFTVMRFAHVGKQQERFEEEGGKGRYISREPMNAAKKAARQIFRDASGKDKSKAVYLEIRETTRGTPSNLHTYKATYKRTSERKDVGGKVIDKKMKIDIVSVPSKQFKGGGFTEFKQKIANMFKSKEGKAREKALNEFLNANASVLSLIIQGAESKTGRPHFYRSLDLRNENGRRFNKDELLAIHRNSETIYTSLDGVARLDMYTTAIMSVVPLSSRTVEDNEINYILSFTKTLDDLMTGLTSNQTVGMDNVSKATFMRATALHSVYKKLKEEGLIEKGTRDNEYVVNIKYIIPNARTKHDKEHNNEQKRKVDALIQKMRYLHILSGMLHTGAYESEQEQTVLERLVIPDGTQERTETVQSAVQNRVPKRSDSAFIDPATALTTAPAQTESPPKQADVSNMKETKLRQQLADMGNISDEQTGKILNTLVYMSELPRIQRVPLKSDVEDSLSQNQLKRYVREIDMIQRYRNMAPSILLNLYRQIRESLIGEVINVYSKKYTSYTKIDLFRASLIKLYMQERGILEWLKEEEGYSPPPFMKEHFYDDMKGIMEVINLSLYLADSDKDVVILKTFFGEQDAIPQPVLAPQDKDEYQDIVRRVRMDNGRGKLEDKIGGHMNKLEVTYVDDRIALRREILYNGVEKQIVNETIKIPVKDRHRDPKELKAVTLWFSRFSSMVYKQNALLEWEN